MRICENGVYRDMTTEEIALFQEEVERNTALEKKRPFTADEVYSMLITEQINTLAVDDDTALRMKEFYPKFEDLIGKEVGEGFKFQYGDKLWKTIQPTLTIQEHYPPSTGTESLYARIDETHDGTKYDPIPYDGNMALENGKYYSQNEITYLCTRDTINPVYNTLNELVGIYVEEL